MPVCLNCDLSPEKTLKLLRANVGLSAARAKWKAARSGIEKADEIVAGLPVGHPDGTEALQRANVTLVKAGEELQAALGEYLKASTERKKNSSEG